MNKTISGQLIVDSPVDRGNSGKTITISGNPARKASLPGRIGGSAQAVMRTFTGLWPIRKISNMNYRLMDHLWWRLYGESIPNIKLSVSCTIDTAVTDHESYFDMRMGIVIDQDHMTQTEGQNLPLESVCKGSRINFQLTVDENRLDNTNKIKLVYLVEEIKRTVLIY